MPVFAGNDDDDLKRFFELYKGYIHSIGINPSAVAGNPAGWKKAMGKRVKLKNILFRAAHGDEVAFKTLAGNAANCPVNTWVNPSGARNIMAPDGVGANVLVTNVWPDYAIEGNRDIWLNRASMEFTNDPLNHNAAGSTAGAGVAIAGGAGAGHPYQNTRRQLRFGNLFQENMPVRDFYNKVRRSAELLGYGNDVLVNQFLRGLNDNCAIEAERIVAERDIEELVGLFEQVEKRKAELHLGREIQENIRYQRDRQIIPEQLPPVSQEPESLKTRDVKSVYRPKPKPKPRYHDDWEVYAQDGIPDEGPNPFDEVKDDDRYLQQIFDMASRSAPRNTLEQRLAGKIAKRIAKVRERREDAELNRAMRELFLDDHNDPIDTSNAIQGVPIELVQENYESAPQEQPEVQEEYLGLMAMDIDVARLENTKDFLAINGNINVIDIQCLANSCANVSFIQEEAVSKLKLKAD
ncbi:hypothetical protein RclHR1_07310008 [Rhizophagus clarus]|uniref:Uncharacterized protein n=1 Tax=Rhizophagus clarus TaxID=94130 RepID=A0A2Z6RW54_9GLOM|nr:hypothetical protein RclHR1_07310008 [Rhizophagus clarus]